ncbi:MAG: hypothetical protein GY768_21820 [Planctomycetaceae bacterium]|nr:hypothetical protein [Planctomycetaceae bacterium]
MKFKTLIIAIACVLVITAACQACPTCKQGIAEGGDHEQIVRGYFWSILFMMSMPFVIFTSLCTYFYLLVRKARLTPISVGMGSATLS